MLFFKDGACQLQLVGAKQSTKPCKRLQALLQTIPEANGRQSTHRAQPASGLAAAAGPTQSARQQQERSARQQGGPGPATRQTQFSDLPSEIHGIIGSYLPRSALGAVAQTSKTMRDDYRNI